MTELSRKDIESLMKAQQDDLAEPSTMVSIHNLLRINKLDEQYREIMKSIANDSSETHAMRKAMEQLADTVEKLLPPHHAAHHIKMAEEFTAEKIKDKQWRTIKTSAMAGIIILIISFVGTALAKYAMGLLTTTGG